MIEVMPIEYSSTTMKLVKLDNKRKMFPSLQFREIISIANSDEWDFDKDKISLSILRFLSNDEQDNISTDRISENKLITYSRNTNSVKKNVVKLTVGHSSDQSLLLFDDYQLIVTNSDGSHTFKKLKDIKSGDSILTLIFGNVTSSLSVISIESIGEYEFQEIIQLKDIEDNEFISIGDQNVEVYVR